MREYSILRDAITEDDDDDEKKRRNMIQSVSVTRYTGLGLKAGSGPDPAEATEITECVRTEFTEHYGKLRSSDTGIQRRYR